MRATYTLYTTPLSATMQHVRIYLLITKKYIESFLVRKCKDPLYHIRECSSIIIFNHN